MQINVNGHHVECFDLEKDYLDFLQLNPLPTVLYHGRLFGIPSPLRLQIDPDLIAFIKKNVHIQTNYVIIHQ